MDVTLLYFEGCPSWQTTHRHLLAIADERTDLVLELRVVDTPEEADRTSFRGSPSIVVGGEDLFADPDAPVGLSCRVYATDDGLAGSPTIDQIRSALASRS